MGRAWRRCGAVAWVVVVRACIRSRKWRRHEREDDVERGTAQKGDSVDESEVDLPGDEQEGAEEEEEEDRACEVRVVHDVLVDARERVEHC
jgi:hypothetical protein